MKCWPDGGIQSRTGDRIERFEYPAIPFTPAALSLLGLTEDLTEEAGADAHNESQTGTSENLAKKLAEETRQAFAAGRERGLTEGGQLEREAHAAATRAAENKRKQQAVQLVDQFARARERYLQAAEKEVVKLALAVAARILRREAHMDPLLLTGAVRVALGQLTGSTEVRLQVPANELDLWKETLELLPNQAVRPQVTAGEGMQLGDCLIDTTLGSVDLGIRSQLGEIERGFFDSSARRTAPVLEPAVVAVAGDGA